MSDLKYERIPCCPICNSGMGSILNVKNMSNHTMNWCTKCNLDHHVEKKYYKLNGSIYNEEQFNRLLKLKAFW